MPQNAAVLTGDLIGSTQAGQAAVDEAMQVIESVARNELEISGQDVRFARFRGDGWQIYSNDEHRVFRLTVLVLASLRRRPSLPQTRLAVEVGTVSFLPQTGLAGASGEVFSMSGRNLDSMSIGHIFLSKEADARWQRPLLSYLEWQSSRWSPEQAEAVALAFRHDPPRKRNVSDELGITRQAAEARLNGAGYGPLSDADIAFHIIPWAPI